MLAVNLSTEHQTCAICLTLEIVILRNERNRLEFFSTFFLRNFSNKFLIINMERIMYIKSLVNSKNGLLFRAPIHRKFASGERNINTMKTCKSGIWV